MKKSIVVVLFCLVAAMPLAIMEVAAAQGNASTAQMQLVASPVFTARVQYLGADVMADVLEEPHDGSAASPVAYSEACHTLRANYARNFLASPASFASVASVLIASTNESGAVIVGSVIGEGETADSSATDGQLQQAIRFRLNALAGCDTGS